MSEGVAGSPSPGTSSPPAPGSSLRPAPGIPDHELLHPIGRGAYGEVWLARSVVGTLRAVKVVYRQDFGDAQPFDREFHGIQKFEPISRSHEGLIDILQIGRNDTEGNFYYVMELADAAEQRPSNQCSVISDQSPVSTARAPLITGHCPLITSYTPRTLRHELKTRGRLPLEECVELGLALTSALEHLHRNGLVHRDIKPSNIIFVNGKPKLADIGLVAGVDEARSFVGTEGFIPPEGPGKPQADLYSLGKVLYEAAMGRSRVDFPSLPKDWDALSVDEQSRLMEFNEVLVKACESDPSRRYRSAEEMHRDLERLQRGRSIRRQRSLEAASWWAKRAFAAALLLLLVGLAAVTLTRQLKSSALPAESKSPALPMDKASVFVLPFRNDGTNGVPDDLRGRITDAFIDSLASIDGVRRSPRKSGWVHQDEETLLRALARTNDMRHILTGRTSGGGDALTLTLCLRERGDDQPAWTDSFSGTTNDVVGVEQAALKRLAEILGLKVTGSEQRRIDQLLTNNLEALGWLRRARATYREKAGTQAGYTEVQMLAQKAFELDPRYVDAKVTRVYQTRNLAQDRAPVEIWTAIESAMGPVLEREDDTHAGALNMGAYALFYKRDWNEYFQLVRRLLQSTSEASKPWLQAFVYRMFGWFEEAQVAQRKFEAENPEPRDVDIRFFMAASRWVERRYEEGAQIARRTLELYPGHAEGYFWLAHCLIAKGEFEPGLAAIEKAQKLWPKQELTALRGYAYAKMGQPQKAREVLRDLMQLQRTDYLQPYFVARVHAVLGENQAALDWLEKAEADRSEYLIFVDGGGLRTDPAWAGLQNEPRYWQLCEGIGLGKNQWPVPKPKELP
jgi:serine/threonine protein kinase/tetratricopeptide (TPR) repeat protein